MSWLSSLFTGSNPTLSGDKNNAGQIEGFATGVGEGDISADSAFQNAILGGNQADIAKLLAPQIQTMQKQGQQQLATTSQFGNRSGGTNASNQQNLDTTRANIDNGITSLTGQAATNLGNLGTSTLNTGLQANEQQAQLSQEQMQNFINSILGQATSGAVNYGESFLPIAHGG